MKHKPKHLKCPHCDYTTAVLTWLKDHMRRHSQESPFQCTFCTYTAKSAGRLKVRTSPLRLSSFSKIGVCFGESGYWVVGLQVGACKTNTLASFFIQNEANILQPITITQAQIGISLYSKSMWHEQDLFIHSQRGFITRKCQFLSEIFTCRLCTYYSPVIYWCIFLVKFTPGHVFFYVTVACCCMFHVRYIYVYTQEKSHTDVTCVNTLPQRELL